MQQTLPIQSLHLEYNTWIAELNFDTELIRIFESHLAELVSRNSGTEIRAQIEHFQNQFIRQKEVIDELKHELNIAEKQLAGFAKEMSAVGYENERLDNHAGLRDKFLIFRKIFSELKEEFHRFESKRM
jgi:hypothetical protein